MPEILLQLLPYAIGALGVIVAGRLGVQVPGVKAPVGPPAASAPPPPAPPVPAPVAVPVAQPVAHPLLNTLAQDLAQLGGSPWLGVLLQLLQSNIGGKSQHSPTDTAALSLVQHLLGAPSAAPAAPAPAAPKA